METNGELMKDASQAMIGVLSGYEGLDEKQQTYVGIMVAGFLIATHGANIESAIEALKDSIGQYQVLLEKMDNGEKS